MATVRDPDRRLTLDFHVTIRTIGHPSKTRHDVGQRLAQLLALKFFDAEVRIGGKKGNRIILSDIDRVGVGEA